MRSRSEEITTLVAEDIDIELLDLKFSMNQSATEKLNDFTKAYMNFSIELQL